MKIKPCVPSRLPFLEKLKEETLAPFLKEAYGVLEEFNAILKGISHPRETLAALDIREAADSVDSQVPKKKMVPGKDPNILNYRKALEYATKVKRPITNSLLIKIHRLVKKGAKDVGSFRKRQNWIGVEGCPIEKARFYPPEASLVTAAMKNLQEYLSCREIDPLVQLAVYFAQLLIIHPFMDGNGRVGRIIMPLFLWKKRLISHPLFYLSSYFKKHQAAYFKKLNKISSKDDWEGWIIFFLKGLIEEGENNCLRAKAIAALHKKWAKKLIDHFSPKQVQKILGFLFKNPIFSQQKFAAHIDISRATQWKIFELLHIQESRKEMICLPLISAL